MRKLKWSPLHVAFPKMGVVAEGYTIRPSSVWRGLYTVRDEDGRRLGGDCVIEVAVLVAQQQLNITKDSGIRERCREELNHGGGV